MSEEKKKTAREIIEGYDGPSVRIMEVCGTHTHEIFRLGIRKLLPKQVELISGPGCPVCVTQVGFIDEAVYLALECGVTICTFGDLVRVPGTEKRAQKYELCIPRWMQSSTLRIIRKSRLFFWLLVLRQRHRPAVWL